MRKSLKAIEFINVRLRKDITDQYVKIHNFAPYNSFLGSICTLIYEHSVILCSPKCSNDDSWLADTFHCIHSISRGKDTSKCPLVTSTPFV